MIHIRLNGEPCDLPEEITVAELIRMRAGVPELVVAEVNERILKRSVYDQEVVRNGDTVELLRFVGGG